MEYEKMLDRLYMTLPKEALSKERFPMPKVDSFVQGTKTNIRNFVQLAKLVRRSEKELYKYFTKEFAVPATISGEQLTLSGKFFTNSLQNAFENYVNQFVLCHECKKPDTHYVDQSGVKMLKCEACGAISSIRSI